MTPEELIKYHNDNKSEDTTTILFSGEISPGRVRQIACCPEVVKGLKNLTIVIRSPGGDLNSAYRIINHWRQLCDSLTIVIPEYAKSGATFMSLAADEIVMFPLSELGPLDTQLTDPRGKGMLSSALNGFKALEYLQIFAGEMVDFYVRFFLMRAEFEIPHTLEKAMEMVNIIMPPIIKQVDPYDIGDWSRHLEVAREYGKRIFQRYHEDIPEEKVSILLDNLIYQYPSHGFVIDYAEAVSLGLPVRCPNNYETTLFDPNGFINEYFLSKTTCILLDEIMEGLKDENEKIRAYINNRECEENTAEREAKVSGDGSNKIGETEGKKNTP